MADVPEFLGIRRTNRSYADLWKPVLFPKALTVAVVNCLADKHVPVNLVRYQGGRRCRVIGIDVGDLYGVRPSRIPTLSFDFDTDYGAFSEMADGVPQSHLVIRDLKGGDLSRFDIVSSVVPDAATRDLPIEMTGPEVNVKTETLVNLSLQLAQSLYGDRASALEILNKDIPSGMDWTTWDDVLANSDVVIGALEDLLNGFRDSQRPFVIQSVWRSDEDFLYMAEDAMDAFAWTDMAFARLFLESPGGMRSGMSRPRRCAARVHRLLTLALSGERFDAMAALGRMNYGVSGDKELLANGRLTNRLMGCDRLVRPALSRLDVAFLAGQGFADMVKPERRLSDAIYDAVTDLRMKN